MKREGSKEDDGRRKPHLRAVAEEKLARSSDGASNQKGKTPEELVHELQVHEIELEMQNEELRGAQIALEEARDKYASLYDFAPVGYFTFTREGRIEEVNLTGAGLLGVVRPALVKGGFRRFVASDDADRWHRHLVRVLEGGEGDKQVCEVTLRREDGSTFPARLDSIRMEAGGGTPVARTAVTDIAEQRRAAEAVRESEEKYRTVADFTYDWEYWIDPNGHLLYVSPSCERVTGYRREEFQNDPGLMLSIIHPDDRAAFASHLCRHDIPVAGPPLDFRIVTRDGEERWINHRCLPVNGTGGRYLGRRVSNRDITDRKRAEGALRKSEAQLRAILDATPFPIALVDVQDDKIDFWSRSALTLFGHTAPTAEEWYHIAYPDPDYRREVRARWKPSLEEAQRSGQAVNTGEYQIACRNGSIRVCELYAAFLEDRLVVTFNDVTERKRAEEERGKLHAQLQQAQKMESVGRLAGGVAHDFNNMLGVILGNVEVALGQVHPSHSLYACLQEIQEASKRSAALTRQLLAFARRQTVAPKVLDLNETVDGMLKMLRHLIGEDIELVWLPGKTMWPVKIDPSQIDQMLANLCVNARDATAGVGKLTIETGTAAFDDAQCADHAGLVPGEYVLLAVSDSGCGMSQETLSHLFEPFFTTKEMGKGTGLGLATVFGIVKQNNGYITVSSEPDQGTTFKIYLPRHQGRTEAPQTRGPAELVCRGRETILLVEDEPAVLRITKTILERSGYTVLAASTPGEAIGLAEERLGEVHLLMTDVIMPEMNGRDLAKRLMSSRPSLKLLFVSGYTADVIASQGMLDAGVNFIQKPFSMRDLAARVRQTLDG
jgi:two-component system, cell cycle sensor histidine kinase and response regulator CckA